MNNFIYSTPTKVYFGVGEEKNVGKYVAEYNVKKVLLHYGGGSAEKSGLLNTVRKSLNENNISFVELGGVKPNPELSLVRKGIELCKKENADFVLAVGGGSVLDSAKDIANGVANDGTDVWDFSVKKASPTATLKKGCILTISAAGSEMSDSCVITNTETKQKRGYGSSFNRMDFAIENPELTYTVSKYQTACGTVDIGMHTIERFFNKGEDTYTTDGIALSVIKSIMKAGLDAYNNPADYNARANMMWLSSLAHNGLTGCGREAGLSVHQLEHEVSGMYPEVAHGAGLAALWCSWARYVYKANMGRFLLYANGVWDIPADYEHPEYTVNKAIDMQENFYKQIGMPTSLKELGVKKEDIKTLALNCSFNKTRTINGYMPLTYKEIYDIFMLAYGKN